MRNLIDIDRDMKHLKHEKAVCKRNLHTSILRKYPYVIMFCDLLLILAVCFNLGALGITNYLVSKEMPTGKVLEVNPVTAEHHNYQVHPEYMSILMLVAIWTFKWCLIIMAYMWYRWSIYKPEDVVWLSIYMCCFTFLLAFDFVNNTGILLGRL